MHQAVCVPLSCLGHIYTVLHTQIIKEDFSPFKKKKDLFHFNLCVCVCV